MLNYAGNIRAVTFGLGRLALLIFLFLPVPINAQHLSHRRTQSFDQTELRRVRNLEAHSSHGSPTNNSGIHTMEFQGEAYLKKLNYAKKLVRCFTKDGNELPQLNLNSRLINNAQCRPDSDCDRCLSKVKECERTDWTSTECANVEGENMENYTGNSTEEWMASISPTLAFHCYRPVPNKTNDGFIDAYFRMEYTSEQVLENLTREHPQWIPRIFLVEKLGKKENDIAPTFYWIFDLTAVPIDGNYTVRVTPIAPAAVYATQTLPPMHFAGKGERSRAKPVVVSVEYDKLTIGKNSTNLLIRWKSGLGGNASCHANVFFLDEDADDYMPHERKEPELAFWTKTTKKLSFEKSYEIRIMEKFDDVESDLEDYKVEVPSCFQVYNYSFQDCPPPAPKIVAVSADGEGSLTVLWEPPQYSSYSNTILHYNLTISQLDAFPSGRTGAAPLPPLHTLQKHVYSTKIFGNQTSIKILARNTTFGEKIAVMMQAYSEGGASVISRTEFEFPKKGEDNGLLGKIWIIALVAFVVVATIVALVWLKSYRDKLQRKKQLHEYFEKLDKESIQPDPATVDRYSSKWEIPLSALVIGDVIGEGAFGLVRKAMLYQNGKKIVVAVKSLRDGVDDKESDKFWEEFNILRGLDPHQHVVGLVGIVKSHVPALVVEYCSGGDLQSHLRKASQSRMNAGRLSRSRSTSTNDSGSGTSNSEGRVRVSMVTNEAYFMNKFEPEINITELDLLSYSRQICSGMEFLSSNKIVHRDLAARNVLIGHNRTLKIADFGLSRDIYEQNWYKKSSDGKIPIKWMALECLLQEVYTAKSDVWSFGILLWEIVTFGGNPYPGIENTRIFDLLKTGYRMARPENCSDELYQLMLHCWQENPKDRPDFSTIRKQLEAIIESSNLLVYMNVEHFRQGSDLSEEEEDDVSELEMD